MGQTKKGKRSKEYAQQVHFRRRLLGRYEIEDVERFKTVTLAQIHSLAVKTIVEKQSLRISVHMVHYEGQNIRVVYDKERKNLVSVLVPD